jgi:hypothetical protein
MKASAGFVRTPIVSVPILTLALALAGCSGGSPASGTGGHSGSGGARGTGGSGAGGAVSGTGGSGAGGVASGTGGAGTGGAIGTGGRGTGGAPPDGGGADQPAQTDGSDAPSTTDAPSDGGASEGAAPPTAAAIQAILSGKYYCEQCHDGLNPPEGDLPSSMDLTNIASRAKVVGVSSKECPNALRIVAGDPEASYLVSKVIGHAQTSNGCFSGVRMPAMGLSFMTDDEIQMLKDWIRAGALP